MKQKISRKQQLLNNILRAQATYPDYADLFEDIRIAVSNDYPRINSRSLWEITCPICGESREVEIGNLYRGNGLSMCQACHARITAPEAFAAGHDARNSHELHRKAALTALQNGTLQTNLSAGRTTESQHKGAITRLKNGSLAIHSPEASRKAALTQWSKGTLNSDTCHKALINGWKTRKNNS